MYYRFSVKTSLQIMSKLVKFVPNSLPFCQLKVVFQSPCKLKTCFILKIPLIKNFTLMLIIVIQVVTAILCIMVTPTDIFSLELQNIWCYF